jgi:ABC-2 type transport system permease protein
MPEARLPGGFIRSMAFVRKELVTVWRQPRLMATLVIGPFLILLLFGLGYRETPEPFETLFVVGQDQGAISADLEQLDEAFAGGIEPVGTSDDPTEATRRLSEGEVDLVVIAPEDPTDSFSRGEHAEFSVVHSQIDPVLISNITLLARLSLDELNRQALTDVVSQAQDESRKATESIVDSGAADPDDLEQLERFQSIDPGLLVRPFTIETTALVEPPATQAAFYAPGVLVLLVQHLAITFAALSLVQERRLGTTELYRISPLRTKDTMIGKYLAFLIMGSLLSAALIGSMALLGVEIHGRLWQVAGVIVMVVIASLGLGFALSGLARTDSQAVQYSMVVLLVSIFFTGFVLPLDQLTAPVRYVSLLVPATYGISALQDVIFRGQAPAVATVLGLVTYTVVVTVLAWVAVRREVRVPRRVGSQPISSSTRVRSSSQDERISSST